MDEFVLREDGPVPAVAVPLTANSRWRSRRLPSNLTVFSVANQTAPGATVATGVAVASSDAGPAPAAFTARRRNRYATSLLRRGTVYEVACAPPGALSAMSVQASQGWDRYWYPVMVASFGFVHASVTCAFPAVAVTPAGFAGAGRAGVAVASSDAGPPPPAFTARSWKAWATPFDRPVTVYDISCTPSGALSGMSVQAPQAASPALRRYWYPVMVASRG